MQKAFPHFRVLHIAVILALLFSTLPAPTPAQAGSGSPNIVISKLYGAGGSALTAYSNDFIELFNRGTVDIDVSNWSVQYADAGSTSWSLTSLAGTIRAGHYYLVQGAKGIAAGVALPTPDVTGGLNLNGSTGKVALVSKQTALTCAGKCTGGLDASVVDFVGYGTSATDFEGSGYAPAPSTTTPISRKGDGCTDTDDNKTDWAPLAASPRNSLSQQNLCPWPTPPTGLGSTMPNLLLAGEMATLTVSVTPGTNPASTAISVKADLSSMGGSSQQAFTESSPLIFSFQINLPADKAAGTYSLPITVTDVEGRSSTGNISLTVYDQPLPISAIQGASHTSPKKDLKVLTQGIVTAKRSNGFYIQTPMEEGATYGDGDDATSEGLFIFTTQYGSSLSIGDLVRVYGKIAEYTPGSSNDLKTTEMSGPDALNIVSHGNPLPDPIVIGTGGRIPPQAVIESGAGNIETDSSMTFDPVKHGIDFYESLESMRVQVNNAVATGPTKSFSNNREISVVGDNGDNATTLTARNGLLISKDDSDPDHIIFDYNPERIILNDLITGGPVLPTTVNVGDRFAGAIVGVIDYRFSNYKLQVTTMPAVTDQHLAQEVTLAPEVPELSVATFNVENLSAVDPQEKFDTLASLIINNLKAPDVLAIEEIQDNDGAPDTKTCTPNGVVDAAETWTRLISAIKTASGEAQQQYQYKQIDPVDDQDGGAGCGNIRQGFLYRTDRGLSFVDRGSATATTANDVDTDATTGAHLTLSPGRIDPTNMAFADSRKPLAGEFMFRGHKVFMIANHFNSKSGDQPLFGAQQPPTLSSEDKRNAQANAVKTFVSKILTAEPNANVIVLGDLNDFQFSTPLVTLKSTPLHALIETLPLTERYTYVFDGSSQAIDHTLISDNLFDPKYGFTYDVVHVNAEFADRASDHDPQVTLLNLNDPPTDLNANPRDQAYTVAEGGTLQLSATATDPEQGALTYAWDLDGNGSFETPGQTVNFTASSQYNGPTTVKVAVQVTDDGGKSVSTEADVNITNTAPTGYLSGDNLVNMDEPVTITFTADDPSKADKDNLHYAFDCETGNLADATYANSGVNNSTVCTYSESGTHIVSAVVIDPDGGRYLTTMTVLTVDSAPILNAEPNGSYSVAEGGSIQLTATATDPEGDTITYAWDLDNDGTGTFETPGSTATFNAGTLDGGPNRSFTIKAKATDQHGASTTKDVVIAITNTAPSGYLSIDSQVEKNAPVTITFTADDPSAADKTALHFAFDCNGSDPAGATYANSSASNSTVCTFTEAGTHFVSGVVIDPDGGQYLTDIQVDVPGPITHTYYSYLPVILK